MKNSTDTGSSRRSQSRAQKRADQRHAQARENAGRQPSPQRARTASLRTGQSDKRVRAMEAQLAEQIMSSPFSAGEIHDLQQAAMEYVIAFQSGGSAKPLDRHKGAKKAALSRLKGALYEFADKQFKAAFYATQHIRC